MNLSSIISKYLCVSTFCCGLVFETGFLCAAPAVQKLTLQTTRPTCLCLPALELKRVLHGLYFSFKTKNFMDVSLAYPIASTTS